MNTRRSGSRSSWASNQSLRRFRTSGRFCSAACAVFFKRQAAAVEEGPKRRPSRIHITLRGKLVEHLADGHVRRGIDEPENVLTVRIELGAARLSLTASRSIAGLARPANPADRRRQSNLKLCRRLARRQPTECRINYTITQILTVGSRHPPPPVCQSTEDSHCSRDLGIPLRIGKWRTTLSSASIRALDKHSVCQRLLIFSLPAAR